MTYSDFLQAKAQCASNHGFAPIHPPRGICSQPNMISPLNLSAYSMGVRGQNS